MFSRVISWDAALCGLPAARFPHQMVWVPSPDGPGRDQPSAPPAGAHHSEPAACGWCSFQNAATRTTNRILIVNDDSSVRASLKKVLEQAGFMVDLASTAKEALVELDSGSARLVLLDLNLPDQNGWDILERITRRSPAVPVVIITGLPGQPWAREVASVAPLLEKPIDVSTLLSTIQQLLEEPREVRLRRFCAFLETNNRIPPVVADYLERIPRYPTSPTDAPAPGLPGSVLPAKP
jgi:CheY-like chemotaxis protein